MALLPLDRAEAGESQIPVSASGMVGIEGPQQQGLVKLQLLSSFTEIPPNGEKITLSDPLFLITLQMRKTDWWLMDVEQLQAWKLGERVGPGHPNSL